MSNIPEGAQRSDDGQWWWDGQQWQPVHDGGGAKEQAADGDRGAARVAQGLPASLYDVTDEQRAQHLAEATVSADALSQEMVDVPPMQDAHQEGTA
jgi:hypothetical protein